MKKLGSFLSWITAWPRAFAAWIHAAFCALMTEEGRKAWALIMAWGCSVAMTAMAASSLWLVRKSAMLAFWLGLSAMLIILIVISGIMVILGVRRNMTGKFKDAEIGITDAGASDPPQVTVSATASMPAPKS